MPICEAWVDRSRLARAHGPELWRRVRAEHPGVEFVRIINTDRREQTFIDLRRLAGRAALYVDGATAVLPAGGVGLPTIEFDAIVREYDALPYNVVLADE